jgi:hypothetical protein
MVRSASRLTTPLHIAKGSNSHARPEDAAGYCRVRRVRPRTRKKPQVSIGCASTAIGAVNFSVL